jgi:hypothetical protein
MRYYLYTLLLLFNCKLFAQSEYQKDAAIWAHVKISKAINKKLGIELKFQQRVANNASSLDRSSINFNIKYKIYKGVRLEAAYAFMANQRQDLSYSYRNRLRAALVLERKFGQLELSYRALSQWRYTDVLSDEEGLVPRWVFRNRLRLKYDVNRSLSPYIAFESFMPLNGKYRQTLSKYRGQVGILYHLNPTLSLEAFYLFQQQLYSNNSSRQDHVYGIGLNLRL